MRLVFIGSSQFGLRCLKTLLQLPVTVAGAVTAPPRFAISYRPEGVTNVLHADVSAYCASHHIDCIEIADGMRSPDLFDRVAAWVPDAFLVAGWYHMVPKRWRELAPAYGLHASLLPDYSGGAPLVWAMINGEEKTGITLFELGDGVDDGPILGQAETAISEEDNIATLYSRIEDLGVELIRRHIPELASGRATPRPQEGTRRLVPQRSPEDGLIDWTLPARKVHDFIRAQTRPYPGAFTMEGGRKVTIWATRLSDHPAPAPGASIGQPDRLLFGCGDSRAIEVTDLAIDGLDAGIAEYWSKRDRMGDDHGLA
jgi:methionyl-tRNA formyltransferase